MPSVCGSNIQTPPDRNPGAFRAVARWSLRDVLAWDPLMPVVARQLLVGRPHISPETDRLGRGRPTLDDDAQRQRRDDERETGHGPILTIHGEE